jgi:hypothetical protein
MNFLSSSFSSPSSISISVFDCEDEDGSEKD